MIEEKLSGGVQSLEVGLAVLNALLEHNKPIILKELSSKLDMHPAKVHRYLVSLIRMNYAKQLEDGQDKILPQCTLPLTGRRVVNRIISDLGLLDVTQNGLELVELEDNVSFDDIQAATAVRI
jgi:acyl CoA:acetate/3-ketoacid CoA transferase beta subunit